MEDFERLLEVVGRLLEAYAAGELKPSPTPPELGKCFESYRPPRIRALRLNPLVEEAVEELVNNPSVPDALAREFDALCKRRGGYVHVIGCDLIDRISGARSALERKKLILGLEPQQRRGLLEVYAERLLNDALEEYEWSVRGGAEHGDAVSAALELVRRVLKGERPETLRLEGSGPWSSELDRAVIAGARVTFQENPYPELSEKFFAIEVPVTGSREEAAKRLLAAAYSLTLVLEGPGPCDLVCSDMPYREYVVELPCPQDPVMGFSAREMAEVLSSDLGELGRVARTILELRDEEFRAFAAAMKHYWQATIETSGADRVTHLVAALDKILRKQDARSALAALPCKVSRLLSEQAGGVVKKAVELRNRVQHGPPPPEDALRNVAEELEPIARRVLMLMLEKMKEGRYKDVVEQLDRLCQPRR
ncbi:MAG: hypothetical protein LM580_06980 [Thermofilum sp.]|nr:hypothetical protein [Thermofilum sp.]